MKLRWHSEKFTKLGFLDIGATTAYLLDMNFSSFSAAAFSAICALIFSHTARADDLKAMAGKWKVEKAEAGGKEVESDDLKSVLLTITGERYEVLVKDKQDAGTLKIDETQGPKTMDSTDHREADNG